MTEQRSHWKENLSQQAKNRAARRQELLVALECTREQVKTVGLDWQRYDELKMQQRTIVAELATL